MSGGAAGARPEDLALLRLLQMPHERYEDLLAVPADYALERLGAASVSLSRWERDRGLLRCVVNVGALAAGEVRFPKNETFDLAHYGEILDLSSRHGVGYDRDDPGLSPVGGDLLSRHGHTAALSAPVYVDDRLWGVLWATKDTGSLAPDALEMSGRAAEAIGPMIALAERLQTMGRLAFEDPLTGLGNRRVVDDTLADLLADPAPGATVVVCDVDGLKQVNDELGHEAGDRVIVAVADALAAAAAQVPGASAVRLGGDEFAVVVPGAARTAAIQLVEAADARLRPDAITISCGIAAVPAGTPARIALAVADGAQYAAKRRGALLVVASDLGGTPAPRPRRWPGDRRASPSPLLAPDVRMAVAGAVRSLARNLREAPATAHARLEWLGEQLLEPFDLDHWSVSRVDLARPPHQLVVASMGMRSSRPAEESRTDLLTDHAFALADYPLSDRAIRERAWFCVDEREPSHEPSERAVLRSMGKRYVLAVGCSEGTNGSLLEMYGRSEKLDLSELGWTLGLGASAVLGAAVAQLPAETAKMGP